jgi:hypothetical protein
MKAFFAACTVCNLNQHYERTDQVFSVLLSRPTCDVSVDFLDMSAKDRAGTTRRSHHLQEEENLLNFTKSRYGKLAIALAAQLCP